MERKEIDADVVLNGQSYSKGPIGGGMIQHLLQSERFVAQGGGGLHSTEVAYLLLTQHPQV